MSKYSLLYDPLTQVTTDDKYTERRMVVWKVINIIMMVFFTLAAIANLNDSDWYVWVPIYLVPAIFSLCIILKPTLINNSIWNGVTAVILAVFMAYGIYLVVVLVETIQQKSTINNPLVHEEGRETVGMIIIIVWMCLSRFTSIGRPEPTEKNKNLMTGILMITVTLAVLPIVAWAVCFVGDNHKHIGHCSGMFKTSVLGTNSV